MLHLLGVPVALVTPDEALDALEGIVAAGRPRYVATVNPEFLVRAHDDAAFREVLGRAALCLPDGVGVVLAARLHGHRLRGRVTGVDTVGRLAERAAARGWRVFFLGAAPGVAEEAAARLAARYPGFAAAGCWSGSPRPEDDAEAIRRIRAAGADVVLAAYGAPAQEHWLARNLAATGATLGLGVGGAFDFIAGRARRAPRWVQRLGLEWLHRLAHEPWRWRRMLALPRFVWLVARERVGGRRK